MTDTVEALYGLDPESFTAARDTLAKQLKAAGDPAAAASVKALRRPSVAAWLLNLTARERPDVVDAVLDLAGQLREAQSDAMSGRGADALRALTVARRRIVGDAVQAAAQVARARSRVATLAVIDAMTGTVEAVLADPDLAERWQAGMLATAEHAVGFSFGAADLPPQATDEPTPAAFQSSLETKSEGERSTGQVEEGSRLAGLRQQLDDARDICAKAMMEVEVQRAAADAADQAARAARGALKEALRAQAKAELAAATAEQAVWEAADRSRRDE